MQDACTYAQKNRFSGGWDATNAVCRSTGSRSAVAYVPYTSGLAQAMSCSPYDFLDYGNDHYSSNPGGAPSNTNCKTIASPPSQYYYIEVQLRDQISVPVFGVSFTLYTHAVARKGIPTLHNYSLVVLDPHQCSAMSLGAKSFVMNGSAISDSDCSSSSIYAPNGSGNTACAGGWFTAANESQPNSGTSFQSIGSGLVNWAPVECMGSADSPVVYRTNTAAVIDPFASSTTPLTCSSSGCSGTMAGCKACSNLGEVYVWNNTSRPGGCAASLPYHQCGTFTTVDSSSSTSYHASGAGNSYEFFPGRYPGGIQISSGAAVYFNPGVYSIGGQLKITGGPMCVYGAPICDRIGSPGIPGNAHGATCGDADFTNNGGNTTFGVAASTWYYYCSAYGTYDLNSSLGCWGAGSNKGPCRSTDSTLSNVLCTTAGTYCIPQFVNADSTGAASGHQMGGVTFYMYAGSAGNNCCNVDLTGNVKQDIYSPNACPGTGSYTSDAASQTGAGSVDFPAGSATATYTYPTTSLAYADGITSSTAGQDYKSLDVSPTGECSYSTNLGNVWASEFGSATGVSHLHFLVFDRNANSAISFGGSTGSMYIGTMYAPGSSGCGNSCQISLSGTAGGVGPPLFAGQIIADNVSFGGNSTVNLIYRPCSASSGNCGYGPGVTLVE